MQDFNLILRATLSVYIDCIKHATSGLIRNWLLIFASILACLGFYIAVKLLGSFGMAGGFILGILSSMLISLYYSWLSDTVQRDKLRLNSLFHVDWTLFFAVIGVSFILYVVYYLIAPFSYRSDTKAYLLIIYLLIVFLFNALPEIIYIQKLESLPAFAEAARFTKENWIEWYLPFLILLLPWTIFSGDFYGVLKSFALVSPLLPCFLIVNSAVYVFADFGYLGLIISILIANWFMLFRGFLFKELESGSRRRRVYLARQK